MRVTVDRVGGFAGVEQRVGVLDTQRLPAAAVAEVDQCIAELAGRSTEVGADMLSYRITVSDGGLERTYLVPDQADDTDDSMAILLRHVTP